MGNGDNKYHDVVGGIGALKLNSWNQVRLAFMANGDSFTLSINGKVLSNVEQGCGIALAELQRAKITLGEDTPSNNFNAMVRNFQVSQATDEEAKAIPAPEESKTELTDDALNLLANTDEFFFIQSNYEIALFEPKYFEMNRSRVPYKPRLTPRQGKVVICHDIPAGICDDKFMQGRYPILQS